jgi:enoyl-CoA hydratase
VKPEVALAVADGVATVTLDAPQRRNALTADTAAAFHAVLDAVERDAGVAVVVLRGAGTYFCAGADLAAIGSARSDPAREDAFGAFDAIYQLFVRVAELPVPTIAAVRGGAVGAGLNLVLAADVRIVADDAKLQSGFVRIGVHPGGGHFQLLERAVGAQRATAMALLGHTLTGTEAVDAGLALEAVPPDQVDDRAAALAAGLRDPALVRAATTSWRAYVQSTTIAPRLLVRAEQAAQMWSFRRAAGA